MDEHPRPCGRCKGSKVYEDRVCYVCKGRGNFPPPDVRGILHGITTSRGRRSAAKRRFRRSWPGDAPRCDVAGARVYYVWRMARFHGGADVTMPVTAQMLTHGDPWIPELERLAEAVAKVVFGTDMAAAFRWYRALGGDTHTPAGLPPTAYESGPVVDASAGEKPEFELYELL